MARKRTERGSSCVLAVELGRPVRARPVWYPWLMLPVLIVALIFCSRISAQNDETEVHIRPRTQAKASVPQGIDPALLTHTKPVVKDVDVVLVPVTVADSMDRMVAGLDKGNFELFEGGSRQEIRYLSSEDAPISLGVIFDTSGSMADKIEKSRQAVVEFFRTANPQDEFFLINFSDRPELLVDYTSSVEEIQSRLPFAIAKGRTALLDAIYLGVSKMRSARNEKKALLIISDGGDNRSRYTEGEIKSLVRESDVQLYAIGLYDAFPRTMEEQAGPALLTEMAEVTGGRSYAVDNPNDLPGVATKIGFALRNQYVLAYRPTNPVHDGKWRKIKVKLLPPKGLRSLRVYAKTGYYAPQN